MLDIHSKSIELDEKIEKDFSLLTKKIEEGYVPEIIDAIKNVNTILKIIMQKNKLESLKEEEKQDLCKTKETFSPRIFGELTSKFGKTKALELYKKASV